MSFHRSTYLIFVALLQIGCSCNRMKEKSSEAWTKTKQEVAEQNKKWMKKGFDAVFGGASVKETSFDEQFTSHPGLEVEHLEGAWIDLPAGYYYCFLKYKADKKQVMRFIEKLYTKYEDISDKKFTETTGQKIEDNLKLLETDYPDAYKQVSFFSDVLKMEGLVYYSCSRYPKSHIIAFDPKTGIIYHHFERYSD